MGIDRPDLKKIFPKEMSSSTFFWGVFLGIFVGWIGLEFIGAKLPRLFEKKPEVLTVVQTEAPPECPTVVMPTIPGSVPGRQLSAPIYRTNLPDPLRANVEREARVAWEDVSKASAYRVYLYNQAGDELKSYSTTKSTLYMKELPVVRGEAEHVEYYVRVAAVGSDGENGPMSVERKLLVKRPPDIVAPSIKQIRVED